MSYKVMLGLSDDAQCRSLVRLLAGDFLVDTCTMAEHLLAKLAKSHYDLLVLDMDLSDMPGSAVMRILRHEDYGTELPVVAIGSKKSADDPIQAFELGVDDFLSKPFDPREVAVRVMAVIRRKTNRIEHRGSMLSLGGIELDPGQRRCVVAGRRVALRPGEFNLLEILMKKAGRVLTRPYLLTTVSGMSPTAHTRAVDVMVARLRRKLGNPAGKFIETVTKLGYCFVPPES